MRWTTDLVVAVAVLWLVAVPGLVHAGDDAEKSADVDVGDAGLSLQSVAGPVTLEQLQGRVVLMFFGFTSCADVCPMTLSKLSRALTRLTAEELNQVVALFISVDPERDTPQLLKKYTDYFHANIIGVTAEYQVLDKLSARYGVFYERRQSAQSARGYVIAHTPDILILDEYGQLLETRIEFAASADQITSKIREVL